ncbi:Alpha/Beta hydrolase protein [Lasiosphaeria ovina]|uniref:Alpha/Beta hydrolase protein n=1 Tax=Lasiosphaeria ovina TaxID=92902 RepID=A0AAE0NBW9_9PEZI|nr:Alpha/Beta hydrolase protein [Lasiosphaeria ovina]
MASITNPPFSGWEKAGLALQLTFAAPVQLLYNFGLVVSRAAWRGLPLGDFAHCGFIRFVLCNASARQVQYLSPPTAAMYELWINGRRNDKIETGDQVTPDDAACLAAAGRLQHEVEPLPDGASSLLWLGNRRRATKFVYFLHGGGYTLPIQPGHLEWCLRAYILAAAGRARQKNGSPEEDQQKREEEVAVAVLQYTLSPGAQYPTQLCQAAAGLAHLLASGIAPGNIVVGGDSAGANLTAQLVSHLLHPHALAPRIKLAAPLAGVFLVSPWVSARVDTASFAENDGVDMLSASFVRSANNHIVGGAAKAVFDAEVASGEGWAMPADVDASWWDRLRDVTPALYVTVGKHEVLRDQGVVFTEAVRRRNAAVDVRLEVMDSEAHDFILLDGQAKRDGDPTKRMRAWASSVLWP